MQVCGKILSGGIRSDASIAIHFFSAHGTYIGSVRLEGHKPTQLPIDSKFRFGASTRTYVIRERPQAGPRPIMEELEQAAAANSEKSGTLLGLPETETELDNLTEFNTAHNRRITMLGIAEDPALMKKRRKIRITFQDGEDIINPEDVDPSVGRFRNMVETTIIPKKRPVNDIGNLMGSASNPGHPAAKRPTFTSPSKQSGLYDGIDTNAAGPSGLFATSLSSKLGIPLPNPAPEVDMAPPSLDLTPAVPQVSANFEGMEDPDQPKKKKYAKEAWPGKKPTPSLLG